jgi:hypothetical protein
MESMVDISTYFLFGITDFGLLVRVAWVGCLKKEARLGLEAIGAKPWRVFELLSGAHCSLPAI